MSKWRSEGWNDKAWDTITDSAKDLWKHVAILEDNIGHGGGAFDPGDLIYTVQKLEAIAKKLRAIAQEFAE